ncbi:MAG: glycosyltransferase [Armatimonadetes bacterium]|nr:glycosyltransferase [Armatimonadota bacterium]
MAVPTFTGERMVPYATDVATDVQHWQRYVYFRPWYGGRNVVDAACGEGYGANYASVLAKSVIGYDTCRETLACAKGNYPHVKFVETDVCGADYSQADLVVSFETIEHLKDPRVFLRALSQCPGTVVISTPNRALVSPGNGPGEKPLNKFHTVEWTPSEFEGLIREHFPQRRIRMLSQEARWPFLIQEGLNDKALFSIAVIGELDLPRWPTLGIVIPTHNGASDVQQCILGMTRSYPGRIHFAIVSNGCDKKNLALLRKTESEIPYMVDVIREAENHGYAVGANIGLDHLSRMGEIDFYVVSNDDVVPAIDCLSGLVVSMAVLQGLGKNPGVIGPVSDFVDGQQRVDIGRFSDPREMFRLADLYCRDHHSSVSQTPRVRGLLMLIHPECLKRVGGFDPRFGLGNWEDDDHNVRTRLAGFTLWIADGSFLHHRGSVTFKRLNIDYEALLERNERVFMEKWGLSVLDEALTVSEAPPGVELHLPLGKPYGKQPETGNDRVE